MNKINSLIYKSFILYLKDKEFCEKCGEVTPHRSLIRGDIIIKECLICNNKKYIDIKKLFMFYSKIEMP